LKRKTKQIGLRISEQDLAALRADAERKGIPYQTLINSILHRYVTGERR
jgi:predicted DNA binding CopG/RHH family protein